MLTLVAPFVLRLAELHEMKAIMDMRAAHEREFVGRVEVPVNVQWLVAERMGVVHACGGFCVTEGRTVIVTDVYDDGTREGKRALSALLDDAGQARMHGCRIYAIVPCDRPALVRHLERRGMRVTGFSME
jgi:hypothetical protein